VLLAMKDEARSRLKDVGRLHKKAGVLSDVCAATPRHEDNLDVSTEARFDNEDAMEGRASGAVVGGATRGAQGACHGGQGRGSEATRLYYRKR
jgi:hypothetical protein